MDNSDCRWAEQTFGGANLGDHRRTRRLVKMAGALAARPGGTVTSTMGSSAQREGAFRLVENEQICPEALTDAMCGSAALT